MIEQDYSREIYDTYYSANKPLRITLKNGKVLEGNLAGVFHGDPDSNEPFVIRWHFLGIGEEEMEPLSNDEPGVFLDQKDIARVEFKE